MTKPLKPLLRVTGPGSFAIEIPDIDADGLRDGITFRVEVFAQPPQNTEAYDCFKEGSRYLCMSEPTLVRSDNTGLFNQLQVTPEKVVLRGQELWSAHGSACISDFQPAFNLDETGKVHFAILGILSIFRPDAVLPGITPEIPDVFPIVREDIITLRTINGE